MRRCAVALMRDKTGLSCLIAWLNRRHSDARLVSPTPVHSVLSCTAVSEATKSVPPLTSYSRILYDYECRPY